MYFKINTKNIKNLEYDIFRPFGYIYTKINIYDGLSDEVNKDIIIKCPKLKLFDKPTEYADGGIIKISNIYKSDFVFHTKIFKVENYILNHIIHKKICYYDNYINLKLNIKNKNKTNNNWYEKINKILNIENPRKFVYIFNLKIKNKNIFEDINNNKILISNLEKGDYITPIIKLSEVSINENTIKINWILIHGTIEKYFNFLNNTISNNLIPIIEPPPINDLIIKTKHNTNNTNNTNNIHKNEVKSKTPEKTYKLELTDNILISQKNKLKKLNL